MGGKREKGGGKEVRLRWVREGKRRRGKEMSNYI
jgi:hypothetical protein